MKTKTKIRCNGCGRRVKDNPQAKTAHILQFHPQVPMLRLISYFNVDMFERLGYFAGERLRGML